MDQPELEVQLKAWRQLAVGKQMLIRVATDGLGLDPDCSSDELRLALGDAIKQTASAKADVAAADEQARLAITDMQRKVTQCEKARATAEAAAAAAIEAKESLEQKMASSRETNSRELKKATQQLNEKQKALKSINVALADTPENVVKKLKALRKEKFDESNARKRAESDANSLRKEKQSLEKRVTEAKTGLENGAKVVEQYRDVVALCTSLHEQLKPLVEDADTLPDLPVVDEELLEGIEKAASQDDDSKGKK